MTRVPLILSLVAAAALAGCNNESHNIVAGGDGDNDSNQVVNADVRLPPTIAATKLYRCSGDNSVVEVDWLSDNKTANVRIGENGSATQVTTTEEGKPMIAASGLSLTGTASGGTITVKLPEGGTKTCHV